MSAAPPPLPWEVVVSCARKELTAKVEALETVSPDRLQRLQGEIASLRWVLALPDRLEADRRAKLESEQPAY